MTSKQTDSEQSVSKAVGDRFGLRVCECGQVGVTIGEDTFHLNRCGRDPRRNMRSTCPLRIVVVEVVADDRARS